MSKILFLSDTHLGVNRATHTTPASREALKQAVYQQVVNIFEDHPIPKIHLGDLFDSYWCAAKTLEQGINIATKVDILLVGNHDKSNRTNAMGAVELINSLVSFPEESSTSEDTNWQIDDVNGVIFFSVHHKLTQGLFDETIEKLCQDAKKRPTNVLLLHCNYDNPFATDDASLNLTKQQAEKLLETFSLIFIGHEHNARTDFNGRVRLVGNTHPTSFSDISDKFYHVLDTETMAVESHLVWDMKKNYLKFDYKSLLSDEIYLDGYQFLEITGKAEKAELPAISRAVANLWKTVPSALMIKNSVTCEDVVIEQVDVKDTTLNTLEKISQELKGTKLEQLWLHYLKELE